MEANQPWATESHITWSYYGPKKDGDAWFVLLLVVGHELYITDIRKRNALCLRLCLSKRAVDAAGTWQFGTIQQAGWCETDHFTIPTNTSCLALHSDKTIPPSAQKRSRNILHTNSDILRFWRQSVCSIVGESLGLVFPCFHRYIQCNLGKQHFSCNNSQGRLKIKHSYELFAQMSCSKALIVC